jgi:hypothetical protein
MQVKTVALGAGVGAVAAASVVRRAYKSADRGRIVVVGGDTGGLAVASRLCRGLR